MTTPTAPDGDPLPATDSGQETCGAHMCVAAMPHHTHADPWNRSWCCGPWPYSIPRLPAPQQPSVSLSQQRRLDVQQPPAQEREACTCGEFAGTSVRYADCPIHCPPAPPSEADSAGEDPEQCLYEFAPGVLCQVQAGHDEPYYPYLDRGQWGEYSSILSAGSPHVVRAPAPPLPPRSEWTGKERRDTVSSPYATRRNARPLAASPGVQGGDGETRSATNPAGGLERDGRGATDVGARERLAADDLAQAKAWWVCVTQDIGHDDFVTGLAEAFAEVRAAQPVRDTGEGRR